ncbi:MAG: type VI secretion protein IcmF/TssM N-terminal domain-containing protein [Candidatus Tectimicrobiota bacterium]
MARQHDRPVADGKETLASQEPMVLSLARFQYELQEAQQPPAMTDIGRGRRQRHALRPWYMLLGPPGSGKTALVSSLAQDVPPAQTPDAGGRAYAWCWFSTAGMLDLSGRFALATPGSPEQVTWLQILQALREARPSPRQPLHGVLLTLAADTLATASPAALQAESALLHQRLRDIEGAFGQSVPVYVLVTRWDRIEGFGEFFSALPVHTRQQVFGWRQDDPQTRRRRQQRPWSTPAYTDIGAMLSHRLEQLRAFILNTAAASSTPRQPIFNFPEECRALFHRLWTALESLGEAPDGLSSVWIRGVFFCSARQQGQPVSLLRRQWDFPACAPLAAGSTEAYFLHDLLTVILPREQHLFR